MLSIFQNASGNFHWPSILAAIGWLIAGVLLFFNLWVNKVEREKTGPWRVTDAQKETFAKYLKKTQPGEVAVEYTSSDQLRSHAFAVIVKAMLESGGYEVWGYMPAFQQTGNAPPRIGIVVGTKSQSAVAAENIMNAFKAIGIIAVAVPQNNNNYEDDRAVVYVGIKQ